jgi:hypothetical protein
VQSRLSSSATLWWKFILPVLWISGFGAGTTALWCGAFHGRGGQPPPDWMRWQFLVMWLAGSALFIWSARRLHRVTLHNNTVTASNFFREIAVPVTAILRVRQSHFSRPPTITLHLDRDTALGRKIVFVPAGCRLYLWEHPITAQLKDLLAQAHKSNHANA